MDFSEVWYASHDCPVIISSGENAEFLAFTGIWKRAAVPKIKKVFVRSGVRFDYAVYDKDETFIDVLAKKHVSGQLKPPRSIFPTTCFAIWGKPEISVYEKFCDKYFAACKRAGLEQYIVPYLMSSHPGSTLDDAIDLRCI